MPNKVSIRHVKRTVHMDHLAAHLVHQAAHMDHLVVHMIHNIITEQRVGPTLWDTAVLYFDTHTNLSWTLFNR